ncbi:MAG: phage recombination protein Bet [bacterium]
MNEIVKYQDGQGQEIMLSNEIVRKYLVHGQGAITDAEIMMFLNLCKYQRLNPFLREVYLIKYGNVPASMVTGKEAFLKRAVKNEKYEGHRTGICEDGKVAWAEVYVKGYQCPIKTEVDYEEYVGKTKEGEINRMWKEKPRTMLKKVALVQALREAFPEDLGGLYSQEEINTITTELPIEPVQVKEEVQSQQKSPATSPTTNENKPTNGNEMTKTIHILVGKLGWTDETYRNYLHENEKYKVSSSKDLNDNQKQELIKDLSMKMNEKLTGEKTKKQNGIVELTEWQEKIKNIPENWLKEALKRAKITDRINMLSDDQCSLIWELANQIANEIDQSKNISSDGQK